MEAIDTSRQTLHRAQRRAYNRVFWILAVLTAFEVSLGLAAAQVLPRPLLISVLLAVAVSKASLIALYYMHLRYESKLLTLIFVVPLLFAVMLAAFSTLAR